ncbi:MAG: DUF4838 domain-containing protein [Planctomycetota bacterium]|jgi:hypothetical protein
MKTGALLVAFWSVLIVTTGTCEAGSKGFPLLDGARKATLVAKLHEGTTLQSFIEKSTGVKLPLIRESTAKLAEIKYPLFVGDTKKAQEVLGKELAELDSDGYIIYVTQDFAIVTGGKSSHACRWAEVQLLRDYMGINQYILHELGTVIPKHKQVIIPPFKKVYEPAFKSRYMSGYSGGPGGDLRFWRLRRRYQFHHMLNKIISYKKYTKTNPEFFPIIKGKRFLPIEGTNWQPRVSDPGVVKVTIDYVRDYFDKNPGSESISLGVNDGAGWCESEESKKHDGPVVELPGFSGKYSVRYWGYVNKVAKALNETHPGKMIGALAYSHVLLPPRDFKLEDNVIPYLTSHRADYWDEEFKKTDKKLMEIWGKKATQIGLYEYFYGQGFSVPRIYNKYFAEAMQYAAKQGASGFYAEAYNQWGLDGPKQWIAEKVLWDPDVDVDALLTEWCRGMFPGAAKEMQAYFERCESYWIKNNHLTGKGNWGYRLMSRPEQMDIYQPEDIKALREFFDAAFKKAGSDIEKERIEYFSSTFKITELRCSLHHLFKKPLNLLKDKADIKKVLVAYLEALRDAPSEDPKAYADKIAAAKDGRFRQGPPVGASANVLIKLINEIAWVEVHKALKGGERNIDVLKTLAKKSMRDALPENLKGKPWTEKGLKEIDPLLSRITIAKRIKTPPVIDGNVTDSAWGFVKHNPWYGWKSGRKKKHYTDFAVCHDGKYLYVALWCMQDNLEKQRKVTKYKYPAWRFASVECFFNPDRRDADKKEVPAYQAIPAYGGGFWERGDHVAEYAVTDNGKDMWSAEMRIPLDKIKMPIEKFPYLRMNFVRNVSFPPTDDNTGWFLTVKAHASPLARGWLVFE